MKIYNYDKKTGEFDFESNAKKDPKEAGKFLIPAYSTNKKPPKKEGVFTQIFKGDKWILEEKHVGTFYNKETLKPISTTIIGKIPEYLTKLKPATLWDKWEIDKWITIKYPYFYKIQKGKWILDTSKKQELKQEIDDVYDSKAGIAFVDEFYSNCRKIAENSKTQDEFIASLYESLKSTSDLNKSKKNDLESKTMQELMDIYDNA